MDFYERKEYLLAQYGPVIPLIDKIEDYIKHKCIVEESNIKYLKEFLNFLRAFNVLHIFTVNYDNCIESFCNLYRVKYTDGFDIFWNPRLFNEESRIKLYKIHGSINWYISNRGTFIKIPIIPKDNMKNFKINDIKLITGEELSSFILYPLNKFEYFEPAFLLLSILKDRLIRTPYIFVIGYSFRDEHIRRIFWDAARENQKLIVFLIDPNAEMIYQERLKWYEKSIPSSLAGKVICLSYNMKLVLSQLRNFYLYHLGSAQVFEEKQKDEISMGREPHWSEMIYRLLDCEYYEKVLNLIREYNINWKKVFNFELQFKLLFRLTIFSFFLKDPSEIEEYTSELMPFLERNLIEQLNLVLPPDQDMILITLNWDESATNPKKVIEHLRFSEIETIVRNKINSKIDPEIKTRIERLFSKLKNIKEYLEFWESSQKYYADYLSDRKKLELIEKFGDRELALPELINLQPHRDINRIRLEKIEKIIFKQFYFVKDI